MSEKIMLSFVVLVPFVIAATFGFAGSQCKSGDTGKATCSVTAVKSAEEVKSEAAVDPACGATCKKPCCATKGKVTCEKKPACTNIQPLRKKTEKK